MNARHLGHVVFYVKDLTRSLEFYRDLTWSSARDAAWALPYWHQYWGKFG